MSPVRALAICISVAVVLLAIVVVVFAHRDLVHSPQYAGTPIEPPKLAGDAILIDQHGKPQHLIDPAFAATFVFFGYTHCPDECPIALATLGHAYRAESAPARAKTRIVFVTVDPAHDTPTTLGKYVANFDPHIVALTDTHAALSKVWDAYGVQVDPQAKELVGHGGTIYAIDGTGHVLLIYAPDVKAVDLTHDANALAS